MRFKLLIWLCNDSLMRIVNRKISPCDIKWVVNDKAELGIKINGKLFWMYKGETICYTDHTHIDGTPMLYRPINQFEFGDCIRPIHLKKIPERYKEGIGWQHY